MGIARRGRRPSRVALLLVPALVALFAGLGPAYAVGGTNLLTNGDFETGGGSLTGWTAVSMKLSLASDGSGGGHAALASVPGKPKATAYGLTTSSSPVSGVPAGESFTANGKVRSAKPGKSVCLVAKELTPAGSVVKTAQQCGTTTATWAPLPSTTLTVATSGDSISLTVQQTNGVGGDSFEVDSLSLVNADTTTPTVPTGLTATAPSFSAVDLSWQPASDPDGAGVTGYVVSRNGATIATLGASATSYRDTTVNASTSYSFTVAAFDFARNASAPSDPATVTTPADSPPSVPAGVTATAVSASEVDLAWTASTDTDPTGVAGYTVTRNGNTLTTLGPNATSYADTSVSPSTTYSYTVTALDTAQNSSAPSDPAVATTPAPAVDNPPSVPGGLTATAVSASEVDLAWIASTDTDATDVGGYTVTRNGAVVATLGASATSYRDTTVGANTNYSYTVTAFDTAHNSSAASNPATVTTPAAQTTVGSLLRNGTFEGTGTGSTAGWDVSNSSLSLATDGVGGGYAGLLTDTTAGTYKMTATPKPVKNSPPTGEQFRATGWVRSNTPGKQVCLQVVEQNASGDVATTAQCTTTTSTWTQFPSVDVAVQVAGDSLSLNVRQSKGVVGDSFEVDNLSIVDTDTSAPTAPGNLTADALQAHEVDLAWNASSDPDVTGVTKYAIYRNGGSTPIATVSGGTTSYADLTVAALTTYNYTVVASDYAGNASPASNTATVTTPAPTTGVSDLWHMDETSGTTMADSGSTPHPGVLHNVALGQPGDPAYPGTSYGFDGTSSFVDVGNSDDLNAGDRDVRIALSLNTTTVPPTPDYDLFRKGEYPGTEYKLELQPNGQFSCELRTLQADGSIKDYSIQPAIDVHDGTWHRLTCSKVGGTMTVSVDGNTFTKSITGSISNNYHMIIGAYSASGGADYYQGRLDEISFLIG